MTVSIYLSEGELDLLKEICDHFKDPCPFVLQRSLRYGLYATHGHMQDTKKAAENISYINEITDDDPF